jgi:hypothetical protein
MVMAVHGPSLHLGLLSMMGNHQCSPFYLGASPIHTLISPISDKTSVWDHVLDRTRDPRASAISNYIGCSFKSMLPVLVGAVLFVSYGEQ